MYYECKIKIGLYLSNCEDTLIKQMLEIEKGRKKLSIIERTTEYAAKIGVVISRDEEKKKYGVIDEKEKIITNQRKIGDHLKNKQQERTRHELNEKTMASMYYKDFREIEKWNNLSYSWLKNWKGIPTTTERKIFEILEQLPPTKYRRVHVNKENLSSDLCRLCNKKTENIRHILSNCDKLAEGLYTTRHNNVLKVLYWKVLYEYKLEISVKPWNCPDQPELERSNKRVVVKWNAKVYCDDYTSNNKPDMIIIDNEKKKTNNCYRM